MSNRTGRAFYENMGGRLLGEPQIFLLPSSPGVELTEVGYVWEFTAKT